jgi:hypothetical protein
VYRQATKNSEFFKGSLYEEQWLRERDRAARIIDENSLSHWNRLKGELASLEATGRFADAQARAREAIPSGIRYHAKGLATAGEKERRAYLQSLARISGKPSALTAARVRQLMDQEAFEEAWVLLDKARRRASEAGDPEWLTALRLDLFDRHYKSLASFAGPGELKEFLEIAYLESEDEPEISTEIALRREELNRAGSRR